MCFFCPFIKIVPLLGDHLIIEILAKGAQPKRGQWKVVSLYIKTVN